MSRSEGQGEGKRGPVHLISAYASLAKPGLTLMSVSTAVAGALLAPAGIAHPVQLALVAAGTLFVGSGAVALNQCMEREYDALMQRTRRRPMPSGLIPARRGFVFGTTLAVLGVILLAFTTFLAAGLAILTLLSYLFAYTPLKRRTHFATAVGGLPGAIPPVIGWTAITGSFATEAYVLFLVLFLWQMPHFLALGWMYRHDYAAGGYRLLPSVDATGKSTARIIVVYTSALLPASVLPFILGMAGPVFVGLVFCAWLVFFIPVIRLIREMTDRNARQVFLASLIYIPAFFCSIGIDRILSL